MLLHNLPPLGDKFFGFFEFDLTRFGAVGDGDTIVATVGACVRRRAGGCGRDGDSGFADGVSFAVIDLLWLLYRNLRVF